MVCRNPTLLAVSIAVLALPIAGPAPAGAAPTCEEGPRTEGSTIVGTPCADTIRAPRGIATVIGEGGGDALYGQRGNDTLLGGPGNDRLYGGIGDDELRGGPDDDRLSGGFGADSLDGEGGNDFARGDATIDAIADTGAGTDTLSYATAATPGFFDRAGVSEYDGLPPDREGRGVYVDLQGGLGDNGLAPSGGGVDEGLEGTSFETVIGSAFPDFIVGTAAAQTIYGGGGADVILGKGGADQAFGGDEGDYCEAPAETGCEFSGSDKEVDPRDSTTIAAGETTPSSAQPPALYLTGSGSGEEVVAGYSAGPQMTVSFTVDGDPAGSFPLGAPPDSVVLAGLGGDDTLAAAGFPESTSVILLGGTGDDHLIGGAGEDALVDGAGDDVADAGARDDAVPNNEGADQLHAGSGEDLFVSNAVCDGDLLDGGPDRDNANWANFNAAVSIEMGAQRAGLVGPGNQPLCSSAPLLTTLQAIEDTEATSLDDVMVGDAGDNQLLGRPGHDSYSAAAGNDSVLANSGDTDLTIDCGEGFDTALIDIPTHTATEDYEDPAPVDCEDVEERPKNSFRPPGTPPNPNPVPESPLATTSSPPRVRPDRKAPRTSLLHRPPRVAFTAAKRRRVAISFTSNEAGSTFRCKLDGHPFKPCRSPRAYAVRRGRHTIGVYAIDAAGNRDRTPAQLSFGVRRR